ncbi:MAG: hypothetical protein CMC55_01185 [Flavobacteriaceae bacterium]|uniref:glycosyltransferase family 2 protein n=1 Tax=Bizionia echini TaxID=649333 RepID=UPI000C8E9523|nr:hypothetical protein [Flavobacteriaceae bacterium]
MVTPLLSVFVITYKQEDYIEQAIRSILNQETRFDFELIISNDCSPDNTSTVIQSIMSNHSRGSVMRYFEHKENLGMYGNFMFALNQCQGKYVAICEGDDYWTDSLKLQKQVDFLEANSDYEVCFTNTQIVDSQNQVVKAALFKQSLTDIFVTKNLPNWAPTLTRVFKNRDFSTLPSAPGLDSVMLLWQSRFGKIKLLNEVTAAYRLHDGGVYSSINEAKKKAHILQTTLVSLELIPEDLMSRYFGKLFKMLVALRFLDMDLFLANREQVYKASKRYSQQLPFALRIKIWFSLIIVSFPFLTTFKALESKVLKVLNHLFIY